MEGFAGQTANAAKNPDPGPFRNLYAWLADKSGRLAGWEDFASLAWLAGLAGWEGLAGQKVSGAKSPNPCPIRNLQASLIGRCGKLAGWEGFASQKVKGVKGLSSGRFRNVQPWLAGRSGRSGKLGELCWPESKRC